MPRDDSWTLEDERAARDRYGDLGDFGPDTTPTRRRREQYRRHRPRLPVLRFPSDAGR